MQIRYQPDTITAAEFADILHRSGLAERRPADDLPRLARMLEGANLLVTARDEASGTILGVARALTDGAYACYLSDLAVDRAHQGQGIGTKLIALTRELAGEETMCLLLSAPASLEFYRKIGMPQIDNGFMFPRLR